MAHPRREAESAAHAPREVPTAGGYALAVLVSLVVLALEISIADALEQGSTTDMVAVVVLLFGALPAAVLGSLGACLVHLLTRRHPSAGRSAGWAGAVGLVLGLVIYRGHDLEAALMLAVATAVGRLAIVPLPGKAPRP